MKKVLVLFLMLQAFGVFAESTPQPAFRLLDGYLEKRAVAAEYGAKNGPWVLMGTGLLLGAASATVWYGSDAIANGAGVSAMSPQVKFGTTLGLGIGAIVLTGIGYALHQFPPVVDERAQYSAIYHEADPVLQESLAAVRLKSLAQTARDGRLVSGWVNLAVVGFTTGLQIADNQSNGRSWNSGLVSPWGWQGGSILGGVSSLLIRSEEETLYEEYQAVVARAMRN